MRVPARAALVARAAAPADSNADQVAAAARLEDTLSKVTGSEVRARPHRAGYQLLLDKEAGDRLVELLAPNPIEL